MGFLDWLSDIVYGPLQAPYVSDEQYRQREYYKASNRWAATNEANSAKGCYVCHKPWTKTHWDHRNVGSVPVATYYCDEHEGASMADGDGTAYWDRPSQCGGCGVTNICGGSGGPINGPTEYWICPERQ